MVSSSETKRRVCVLSNTSVDAMFCRQGCQLVLHPDDADLIVFTGGADVSPMLYGEFAHQSVYADPARDLREANIYYRYRGQIPMAGICRGAQFLHVMNGGSLFQDMPGHAGPNHQIQVLTTGEELEVTSTHHQAMKLNPHDKWLRQNIIAKSVGTIHDDHVEIMTYRDTRCLCYQPHPEYARGTRCESLFFELIDQEIMKGEN